MALKKNILANYIGQFYVIIIGIVMVPYYLKYLGAEAYGLVGFFALMQSWMNLFDMGLSPTLSREVSKVKISNKQNDLYKFKYLLHSLEFIFILFSTVIFISIYIYSDWLTRNWLKIEQLDFQTVSYSISLMGFMIGLRLISALYRSGINGAEEQVWLNKINIIIVTLKFVGVVLVLKFISTDVKYFFEYQLIISIIEFFIFSIKFYKIMDIGKFKLYFSAKTVEPILKFAMGIAYTGGIWILLTQLDKLLLSNILPLKEYGYFVLVGLVTNAILQVSAPISKAILPRMTALLTQGKDKEMIKIYKKSTQFVSIIVFSVVGIIALFPFELLYSWTGDMQASTWASNILFYYVIGNGILAISAFQYYLQYTYGDLKLHVKYNTLSVVISVPIIIFSAYTYGAIGVAITWFLLRLISFLVWIPIVHNKFAPGIHKDWIVKDILPILTSTIIFLTLLSYMNIDFNYTRTITFVTLLGLGTCLLIINTLASSEGRHILLNLIKR